MIHTYYNPHMGGVWTPPLTSGPDQGPRRAFYMDIPATLVVYCELDFTTFPFDKFNLYIDLLWYDGLPSAIGRGVNIVSADTEFINNLGGNFLAKSDIWKYNRGDESINSTSPLFPFDPVVQSNISGMLPISRYGVTLCRKQEYYIWTIFVSLELTMLLQLATFIMPPDALDRSAYSVTVNLAFAVTQQVINGQMPKTSQTIYFFIYISAYLIIGAFVTIYVSIAATMTDTHKVRVCGGKITKARAIDLVVFMFTAALAIACTVAYGAAVITYNNY